MKPHGIALVGCGKSKGPNVVPARELYISTLFRLSLAHAEARAERTFIVSAYYGLLHPDTVVEPYEQALGPRDEAPAHAWAHRIVVELGPASTDRRPVLLLAGGVYESLLTEHLERAGWQVETPLHGMQIGERLGWLKSAALERASVALVPAANWGCS